MILRAMTVAAAILLGGCGPAGQGEQAVGTGSDLAAANAAASSEVAPASPGIAARLVTLDGEGLRLVDPDTGSARPLPFGTPMAATISALAAAFGGPPVEQVVNAECGAGPILHARWANGFLILSQEDRFLGWDSREPGLATADGIGIGSTRAVLEASREVAVEETTLGTEFSTGGLGGLLASDEANAPVTSLWAGLTCHFR